MRLFVVLVGLLLALNAAAGSSDGDKNCVDFAQPLQQGVFTWAKVAPGSVVLLNGEALDVLDNGWFLLGFSRNAKKTALLEISGPQKCHQRLHIASRDYHISRVEGVPKRTVTPSKEHLDRIARERKLVRAAKAQRLRRPDLIQAVIDGLQWPLMGRISGVYGSQRFYNGVPGNPHYGVDVARPTGTPVLAPGPGVITLAEPDLFFSGGTVILDHGYGLSSSFLHMSKVLVEVGQEVKTGAVIGEVGATGRATGPHLDWRMSWRNRRVDPQLLVPPMPEPAQR
ncbi:MAG: peptidase [Gammaproteobacteria bacterium]|nr:MAG: peptidase [Gammaproteobacteria bacterium]